MTARFAKQRHHDSPSGSSQARIPKKSGVWTAGQDSLKDFIGKGREESFEGPIFSKDLGWGERSKIRASVSGTDSEGYA